MPDAQRKLEEGVRLERAGLLDRALALYEDVVRSSDDYDAVAAALVHASDVHRTRCDWDASFAAARKAQEVAREARLTKRLADAMVAEANVFASRGDFGGATLLLDRVANASIDPRVRGVALQNLGSILAQTGQFRAAERAFAESRADFQLAGYARGEAISLNNIGRLALDNGDHEKARPLLEQALRLGRELNDLEVVAMASLNLAFALCVAGSLDRAQDLATTALGYFAGCRNAWREIECLRLIGDINEKGDDCANAGRCYDLALRLAMEIGAESEEHMVREKLMALADRQIGSQRGEDAVSS